MLREERLCRTMTRSFSFFALPRKKLRAWGGRILSRGRRIGQQIQAAQQSQRTRSIFYLIALAPPLSACALAPQTQEAAQGSNKNISQIAYKSAVDQPKTPSELLSNLKWIADTGALLKPYFYQPEQLKRWSSALIIDKKQFGTLTAFELSGLSNVLHKNPLHPLEPSIELVIPATPQAKHSLGLSNEGDERLTVEVLQSVFGTPAQVIDAVAASVTRPPAANVNGMVITPHPLPLLNRGEITHPLGSKDLQWRFVKSSVITEISGRIGGNGVVWELILTQEKEAPS